MSNKINMHLIDSLFLELSKFDHENLSFHNMVIVENLREQIVELKSKSFCESSELRNNAIPPIPTSETENFQLKVAIIDDDIDTQNLLKFYFKKNQIGVKNYYSAIKALDEIKDGDFDLLLVDLMMPEMTGFEFIQKIKKKIDISKTKIMVGSAKSNQLDRVNALKFGAIDYINKPYDLSELVMIIKRYIKSDAA